jgi:hypothetical protein
MENQSFDQHCIVELMGHQRIAGRVTEQAVGGTNFVRVDVPAVNGNPAFTRLLGSAAIYALNPVSEEIALEADKQFRSLPVQAYDIPALRQRSLSGIGQDRYEAEYDSELEDDIPI